jgi:peptidoglycan/LPS O-acetylase OafA/YrhL
VSDLGGGDAPHIRTGVVGASRYFPEVEALRGVAILLVFLFHADSVIGLGLTGQRWSLPMSFVRAGQTGVSLFFIISAFLLALPFLAEAEGGRRVRWGQYYARRALRILPLYYVAVVAACVLTARHPRDLLRGIPYLLFLNGAGLAAAIPPYHSVWWSLATEVQFYVLLPFLPFLVRSRRGRRLGGVLLLVYAVAYIAFIRGRLHAHTAPAQISLCLSVFGRGPFFLCGISAAWLFTRYGDRLRARLARSAWMRWAGGDAALWATLAGLAVLLRQVARVTFWSVDSRRQGWNVIEGLLWTIVLLLLLHGPLRTKRLLSNRMLERLGRISYSVYLIHLPLLHWGLGVLRAARPRLAIAGSLPALVATALIAAVCVALSTLSYLTIERPFLAWKGRVT